jgi:mannitol-1-phosphate 5-dehydrogenase
MPEHVLTGFGFGPIQAGLFAKEAYESGNFARIVIAEIDQPLVDAVRANGGSYWINVAGRDGIETVRIDGVELLNPNADAGRKSLIESLANSTEVTTCLPSVSFYDTGGRNSPAVLLSEGLGTSKAPATIIYAAENHNHAAEILHEIAVRRSGVLFAKTVQFLNTVIGKMSRVVTDSNEIEQLNLRTITPGFDRAFLVEQFNRILVSRTRIAGFSPGVGVFVEKDDLLPFEEAKLYGHNAIHATLAFIAALKGYTKMTELVSDRAVMEVGREAFIKESGGALVKKYGDLGDELFTEAGYRDYAEDLLERMTNPYLADTVARAARDVVRKLGIDDRMFGTMRLALEYGIEPRNMAIGAIAGITVLLKEADEHRLSPELRFDDWRRLDVKQISEVLNWVWAGRRCADCDRLIRCVYQAVNDLAGLVG